MLDQHKDQQNAIKAVSDALYGLTSTAGTDMFEVARYLAAFIGDLDSGRWPRSSALERKRVRSLCSSRGCELLRQVVELGWDDSTPFDSAALATLRKQLGPSPDEATPNASANASADQVKKPE